MTAEKITTLAKELFEHLREDIEKCTTREDHIRVSARANHANILLQHLHDFFHHREQTDDLSQETADGGASREVS